tara:strand:- start:321 stop:629 length:309 start_codon:yes stop_codon:yes gene_type:complete
MPAVARGFGVDIVLTNHGCDPDTTTLGGSSRVFVNGIGIHRLGDANTDHQIPSGDGCATHSTVINSASPRVFADGLPVARVGDPYSGGETVSTGSFNVFVDL